MAGKLLNLGNCSGHLRSLFPTSRIGLRFHIGAMMIELVENAQAIELMAGGKIRIAD